MIFDWLNSIGKFLLGSQFPNWVVIVGWVVPAWLAISTLKALRDQVQANIDSAKAATQANEFARQTLELTRRARIAIDDVWIGKESFEKSPKVKCKLINTGDMPATGVWKYARRSQSPASATDIQPAPDGKGDVIYPHSERPHSFELTIGTVGVPALFTPHEWTQLTDGSFNPPMHIGICVSYWDGFNNERVTESWHKYNLLTKEWDRTYIHQT